MRLQKVIEIQDASAATTAEVSRWLGVAPVTVIRWIELGCPTVRSKPYLLDIEKVEAWRASRK